MAMKVGNIYSIPFKSSQAVTKPVDTNAEKAEFNSISNITPSYSVRLPQKYQSLGVKPLANGLKAHSYKLANGHRVTIVPMEGSPTIVKNYVNVGSMNETDDIKGISHFLEHMAFNGTIGENGYIKLNTGDSFKKIDRLGGWTNASTNYALTDYVNSTPLLEEKDLEEQIKIMAGMTEDLALTPEMIEKEKGPVCSEINMILDNPKTILVDQTVRSLFNIKSSADELVGGSTHHIKNLTREKVKTYYDKYYTPDNMNLVITGDIDPDKVIELVSKNFHSNKTRTGKIYEEKISPIDKASRRDIISDKATSTQIMLGFSGPKSNDTKSKFIFDIFSQYMHSTALNLDEDLRDITAFGSFGLEKISTNPNNPSMMYYILSCPEDSSEKALKLLYDRFSSVKSPDEKTLENIKTRLIKGFKEGHEHSAFVNDLIGNSIIDGEFENLDKVEKIINSITKEDVDNFIKEHLNLNKTALTVVHSNTSIDKIMKNHADANSVSFKGTRKPLNPNKMDTQTLYNNYKIGFYETNNDSVNFNINLIYDMPKNLKPGTIEIYNDILNQGTLKYPKAKFEKIQEDSNLELASRLSNNHLSLLGCSSQEDFTKTLDLAKESLYSPRITEETLQESKSYIKEVLSTANVSSGSLYIDYRAKTNPYYSSKEKILENIDSITVDDLRDLHHYILDNAKATISVNIPNSNPEMKNVYIDNFNSLLPVKEFDYNLIKNYEPNKEAVVLAKAREVSQADIQQTFNFKFENNLKEIASLEILNTLLSSSSIGLFNNLREKEQLAYSVYSDVSRFGDEATISCNILTTTDNKEIGEFSYDNVQKSINGFARQIQALKNSEYTDDDLESAKRILKANLLDNEGTIAKLRSINTGLTSRYGVDYKNKLYFIIDEITRDDINKLAQKAFNNPPIYAIVASKDTLNANKEYLESLKKNN